jgi:hypothetical protein
MALDVVGQVPLLQVYDIPRSVRFHRDTLGFQVKTTSPVLLNPVTLAAHPANFNRRPGFASAASKKAGSLPHSTRCP